MARSDAKSKLTDKQRRFVEEYCVCLNAAEAARRAGYSTHTARDIGAENLAKPHIGQEVQKRLKEMAMSADEALLRLKKIASFDLLKYINNGVVDIDKMKEDGVSQVLKKIKPTDYGREYEFKDPESALVHILKAHGAFTERHEHNITGDITINVKPLSGGD